MTMRGAPRAARDDDDKQAESDEKQYVSPLFPPSHVPPKVCFLLRDVPPPLNGRMSIPSRHGKFTMCGWDGGGGGERGPNGKIKEPQGVRWGEGKREGIFSAVASGHMCIPSKRARLYV